MSKQYIGVWPLATIRLKSGSVAQVYAGDPVPADITDEDLDRLVKEGCLAEGPETEDEAGDPGTAPAGTADEILAEVGNDKALAQVALDEENAKATPRKGLVAKLQAIVEA